MTEPPDHRAMMAEYSEKVAAIRPLLADLDSVIEGAVLAELTAIWLAHEEPFLRDMLLHMQWLQILRSVPLAEWDMVKETVEKADDEG